MGDPVQERDGSGTHDGAAHDHTLTVVAHEGDVTIYQCVTCLVPFLRKEVSDDAVRYASASVDLASVLLWDFHERAVAKYGLAVMAQNAEEASVTDTVNCEALGKEHEWDLGLGKCLKCGAMLFLGG